MTRGSGQFGAAAPRKPARSVWDHPGLAPYRTHVTATELRYLAADLGTAVLGELVAEVRASEGMGHGFWVERPGGAVSIFRYAGAA